MDERAWSSIKMNDGGVLKINFTNYNSIISVSHEDWIEINEKLATALKYVCSQMTGAEVYDLLTKTKTV